MHNVQHYISILETTAVITTILQYLSGALICRKFIKKKSTGDSSGLPFICGFLSCGFWLHYGFLSGEHSVMFVNIVGVMLFFVYILIYYVITVNKKSHIKQFLCILFILIAVIAYVNSLKDYEQSQRIMGIACCVVTVCFFAAPLINLFHVIRIKNSESLPFPLIIMSFLVSTQWLIYGIVISDTYIQLTNFLGCLLSMLQLCLFVCYPPKTFNGQGYKLVEQSVVF